MNEDTGLRDSLLRFFSHPAIGIASSIASVVGLILTVYFYQTGRETRDLQYFVHPAKAAVVKAGQSSRLRVTLDGTRIENDVTAAQIAFWNQGSQSIRRENVLDPLVIRTENKAKILEARLRSVSRDVSGITLDLKNSSRGEVNVTWSILEKNDGGVVQIVYLSDVDTEISASATIEGQGSIRSADFDHDPETLKTLRTVQRTLGYAYVALGLLLIFAWYFLRRRWQNIQVPRLIKWMVVGTSLLIVAMGLFFIFFGMRAGPPIGFQ